MPAGPAPLGFGYFFIAKYVGYSVFCGLAIQPRLQRKVELTDDKQLPPAWLAGFVRTLIGLVVGVVVGYAFWTIPGILTSFALDGLGIALALVLPGGAWVC